MNEWDGRVNRLGCSIVGHKAKRHNRVVDFRRYRWTSCARCGVELAGRAPSFDAILKDVYIRRDLAEMGSVRTPFRRWIQ